MSGKELQIRRADFFAFPLYYYKNIPCIAYCVCMQSRESHAFVEEQVLCFVAHRTLAYTRIIAHLFDMVDNNV